MGMCEEKLNMINPYELEKIKLNLERDKSKRFPHSNNIPTYKGIYFIFDINNNLIYIGHSKNIRKRILHHNLGYGSSGWFKEYAYKISCIEYNGDRPELELKYIKKYKTIFNKESPNYNEIYSSTNQFIEFIKLLDNQKNELKEVKEFTEGWMT